METSQRKQEFSKAYVRAVAATAGYAAQTPEVDDDSVDLTLAVRGGGGTVRSPKLDLQLKCTSRHLVSDGTVNYPLEIKNYEELRPTDFQVPRVLVVVVVPDDIGQWIAHSEEQLLLRHCGYWYSLRGLPPTQNVSSVTVNIPRAQVFDVAGLTAIMRRISIGGLP